MRGLQGQRHPASGGDQAADALSRPGVKVFEITGRPMKGWVMIPGGGLTDQTLAEWLGKARAFAASLPPK